MLKTVGMPNSRRGRRDVPQGRMELHREAEGDADLLGDLGDPCGGSSRLTPSLSRTSDGAARRGRGPVAVLDDPGTGTGHDDRGHGGDVDGLGPVAARADDVDGRAGHLERVGVRVHGRAQPGDLVRRLALGPQGDHQPRELAGRRQPRITWSMRPGGVVRRQIRPAKSAASSPARSRLCCPQSLAIPFGRFAYGQPAGLRSRIAHPQWNQWCDRRKTCHTRRCAVHPSASRGKRSGWPARPGSTCRGNPSRR